MKKKFDETSRMVNIRVSDKLYKQMQDKIKNMGISATEFIRNATIKDLGGAVCPTCQGDGIVMKRK